MQCATAVSRNVQHETLNYVHVPRAGIVALLQVLNPRHPRLQLVLRHVSVSGGRLASRCNAGDLRCDTIVMTLLPFRALTTASRPALGPTQPPIRWVGFALPSGGQSGRDVKLTTRHHQVPSLRMSGAIRPLPHMSSWRGP
jgi:hypothetical protein